MLTGLSFGRPVVAALATIITLLPEATAQVTFEVAPYVGLYLPLGSMLRPSPPSQYFFDFGFPKTSVRQQSQVALGGRVTTWLARRLGLEGTWSYARSGVNFGANNEGYVMAESARLMLVPLTFLGVRSFHVGGGVGIVDHGGTAYEGVLGGTSVAPTVSAGIAVEMGPSQLLQIDAQDAWFRPHLRQQSSYPCTRYYAVCKALQQSTMPGFQHDVILSFGLAFRVL